MSPRSGCCAKIRLHWPGQAISSRSSCCAKIRLHRPGQARLLRQNQGRSASDFISDDNKIYSRETDDVKLVVIAGQQI